MSFKLVMPSTKNGLRGGMSMREMITRKKAKTPSSDLIREAVFNASWLDPYSACLAPSLIARNAAKHMSVLAERYYSGGYL